MKWAIGLVLLIVIVAASVLYFKKKQQAAAASDRNIANDQLQQFKDWQKEQQQAIAGFWEDHSSPDPTCNVYAPFSSCGGWGKPIISLGTGNFFK